jgi:hypothetical protein
MNMNFDKHDRDGETDRWIDEALAQFAKAEPRPGLERRIMIWLAAAEPQNSFRSMRWWNLCFLGAAAALLLLLVWSAHTDPKLSRPTPIATHAVPSATPSRDLASSVTNRPHRPNPSHEIMRAATASMARPTLDCFPSPAPLNAQEQMLALYVQQFPGMAAQIAQTQADIHKQDELENASP